MASRPYYLVRWRDDAAPIEGWYWRAFGTIWAAEGYAASVRAGYRDDAKPVPEVTITAVTPEGATERARVLWALNRSPV